MKLLLIRHGPTEWNAIKRIQGRTDNPLSDTGIDLVMRYRIPNQWKSVGWYSSPLIRAKQTADILGLTNVVIEPALTEMHWGDWEGQILKPLRRKLGDMMRDNEANGLDFRPPNGESPRDVQERLAAWLHSIAENQTNCGAVVHKGIVRCVYALAHSWDMRGESPIQFDWNSAHEFEFDKNGALTPYYKSIPLL
ncbi:MAG: histidine phosphatase family protein [Pseudomonadota bacterium]